ncbi:MAG: DUF2807 domain-containing protein [Gammaproteobacteria bacterium]|nr:DUF2807 domain-containing protein [Gammaproteobacteria bacterium]
MSTVNERVGASEGDSDSTRSNEFQVGEFDKVSTSLNGTMRVTVGDAPRVTICANEQALAALEVKVRDNALEIGPNKSGPAHARDGRSLASHLLDVILKRRTAESRSIAYSSQYSIEITTPRLHELVFGGKARLAIETDLRDSESMKLVCGGVSAVSTRSISAPRIHLVSAGTAALKVDGVKCDSLDCRISGTASVHVNGEAESVSARISGTGSLDGAKLRASRASFVTSGASNASIHAQNELEVKSSGACAVQYLGNPEKRTSFSGVLDCSPLHSDA